jgi:hypothetical protein
VGPTTTVVGAGSGGVRTALAAAYAARETSYTARRGLAAQVPGDITGGGPAAADGLPRRTGAGAALAAETAILRAVITPAEAVRRAWWALLGILTDAVVAVAGFAAGGMSGSLAAAYVSFLAAARVGFGATASLIALATKCLGALTAAKLYRLKGTTGSPAALTPGIHAETHMSAGAHLNHAATLVLVAAGLKTALVILRAALVIAEVIVMAALTLVTAIRGGYYAVGLTAATLAFATDHLVVAAVLVANIGALVSTAILRSAADLPFGTAFLAGRIVWQLVVATTLVGVKRVVAAMRRTAVGAQRFGQ